MTAIIIKFGGCNCCQDIARNCSLAKLSRVFKAPTSQIKHPGKGGGEALGNRKSFT